VPSTPTVKADPDFRIDVRETLGYLASDELEGRGIGGRIVKTGLDYARAEGLKVVPQCSFVRGYIERHQEYADLVA